MNPIDKLITYAVLGLLLAGGLWYAGDKIIAGIQAPVVSRAEKAEEANASVVAANEELKKDNARLNGIIVDRTTRESASDRRLKGMEDALKALAAKDPAVRDWMLGVIPPAVLLQPATDSQGGAARVLSTNQPDPTNSTAAASGATSDQRRSVEPQANTGSAGQSVQPTTGRCEGVDSFICRAYNRLKMKGQS